MINAFTVDVEDYFQVSAFAKEVPTSQWDQYQLRVVPNTLRILDLMEKHQVRGTFFVLGWVADKEPQLVREIANRGHEIGTHSYWHRLVYEQTPTEFADDLQQSIDILQEITGQPITSYRAPSFSITARSQWALSILKDSNIQFDSSIFPIVHDRYGVPDAEPRPHQIQLEPDGPTINEFPPSVHRKWSLNLPISGGGYFRLYPYPMSRHLLRKVNSQHFSPFMFYIHPWEVDPEQPRVKSSLRSRFRHYQNLKTTLPKLDKLLQTFRFGTLTEAWDSCQQPYPTTVLSDQQLEASLSITS
ncbi:MAG: DUF3473 domain-containing protein [Planctomycetaceae bacterium]|nr:DUF3473 domain-containing protein [Planctomycetaceae bacterium]